VCHGVRPASNLCRNCFGKGLEPLTCCPRKIITPDIGLAIQTADDIDLGLGWPNGRGWMDESAALVAGVRLSRSMIQLAEARYSTPKV
jgi:hypothetical protein